MWCNFCGTYFNNSHTFCNKKLKVKGFWFYKVCELLKWKYIPVMWFFPVWVVLVEKQQLHLNNQYSYRLKRRKYRWQCCHRKSTKKTSVISRSMHLYRILTRFCGVIWFLLQTAWRISRPKLVLATSESAILSSKLKLKEKTVRMIDDKIRWSVCYDFIVTEWYKS